MARNTKTIFFSSPIIAILAAMLLPALSKAREKARQAVCMSNLKQIGTAFYLYLQDNDEQFPENNRVTEWGNTPRSLAYYLTIPYGMGVKYGVLCCPSDKTPYAGIYPSPSNTAYSYATNGSVGFYPWGNKNKLSRIPNASRTGYIVDSNDSKTTTEAQSPSRVDPRHSGGVNILFLDGHVEWFTGYGITNPDILWDI